MVAVGVSEWSAKRLLWRHLSGQLVENGSGGDGCCLSVEVTTGASSSEPREVIVKPEIQDISHKLTGKLIVKPDMLIKRRGKLGLVKKATNFEEAKKIVMELSANSFSIGKTSDHLTKWIVESLVEHTDEFYVCITSSRSQNTILFHHDGGVDIGNVEEKATKHSIPLSSNPTKLCTGEIMHLFNKVNENIRVLLANFVIELYNAFCDLHIEYLEINPFTFVNGKFNLLDCAMKVDNCAGYLVKDLWKFDNGQNSLEFINTFGHKSSDAEKYIEHLDSRTGASLKFTLLNPNGRIWTLIAGGGASVVYADTICDLGFSKELANYGEYSGAPKTLEVYQYSKAIFDLMFSTDIHPEGKVLLIGGGIANFTNVAVTFEGIISAIRDCHLNFKKHSVKIYVRRGGPNYKKGLEIMRDLGKELELDIKVFGPESHMTSIIPMALGVDIAEKNTSSGVIRLAPDSKKSKEYELPQFLIKQTLETIERTGSVKCNFSNVASSIIIGMSARAIQTMLDFDYECDRMQSVEAIIDQFQSEHLEQFFWGSNIIRIPVYKTISKALQNHPKVTIAINFASQRSCYNFAVDLLQNHSDKIKTQTIIAEGVPDNLTRHLCCLAYEKGVTIIGPSTVGAIKPGAFKVSDTGGGVEIFTELKLYKPGSVGVVTKSGGLSNEMMNIVTRCTDGVHQSVAIGGDRYPCTKFIDVVMEYENSPDCAVILMVGEIGGIYELEVAQAIKNGVVKKPVIAWCIGTCSDMFETDVSFGHAGAYASAMYEKATIKNQILADCGAYVPRSFEDIPELLSELFNNLVSTGKLIPKPDFKPKHVPIDYSTAKKLGLVRQTPHFVTSITDERGSEVQYNSVPLQTILSNENSIGATIGHLWLKKKLPIWAKKFLEICIPILADHGPCVSGAHNTIVAARADKDLVSSLVSGLLTIGPRFGGAMDDAAKNFYQAHVDQMEPAQFVEMKKRSGERIAGIGHRVKSIYNPDTRVEYIVQYVCENFPSHQVLDFAKKVSCITLEKKQNLILNVDGAIGAALVDMMLCCKELFKDDEIVKLIKDGAVNAFFVLSRSIGLIGHYLDQKRLNQGLYRHSWDDIHKVE